MRGRKRMAEQPQQQQQDQQPKSAWGAPRGWTTHFGAASSSPGGRQVEDGSAKSSQTATATAAVAATAAAEPAFMYQRFQDGESIRILTLQPAALNDDPLIGELTTETLISDPDYEAISYVWGSGDRTCELRCRDSVLAITGSVRDAIARMRLPDRPRRLWVDQICINQDDVAERSQQVRLMNSVYKNAKHVLVWLGRDPEGLAEEAVRTLDWLDDVFADEEKHAAFRVAHSENLAQQNQKYWIPFAKLTKLPWFQRLWIIQEIGTGTPATLFWGAAYFDWERLSSVASILGDKYHYLRTRFSIGAPGIVYLYRRFVEPDEDYDNTHNRGNFIYELHRARHLRSRDPRDHVYAFLGHFALHAGSDELKGLEADYTRPIRDVFCDVAIRELRGATSLICLSANHNHPPGSTNALTPKRTVESGGQLDLPSWVPDWRELPVHIFGSPQTEHTAAGETRPSLEIDEEKHLLHIRGTRVDSISRRSWVFFGSAFQFRQGRDRPRSQHPIQTLWREFCGYEHFNLTEQYRPTRPVASREPSPSPSFASSAHSRSHSGDSLVDFLTSRSRSPSNSGAHLAAPVLSYPHSQRNSGAASLSPSDTRTRSRSHSNSGTNLAAPSASHTRSRSNSGANLAAPSASHSRSRSNSGANLSPFASYSRSRSNSAASLAAPSVSYPHSRSNSVSTTGSNSSNWRAPRSPTAETASTGVSSAFLALAQTLSNACIGSDRSRPYPSIPPTEWLANASAYLLRSGVSHRIIGDDIRRAARSGDAFAWRHRATLVSRYRRFAITKGGYYVMGPEGMEDDDVIVILHGGRTPFVLRRADGEDDGDVWTLIGECYVHGLMNGEGMSHGAEEETFTIK